MFKPTRLHCPRLTRTVATTLPGGRTLKRVFADRPDLRAADDVRYEGKEWSGVFADEMEEWPAPRYRQPGDLSTRGDLAESSEIPSGGGYPHPKPASDNPRVRISGSGTNLHGEELGGIKDLGRDGSEEYGRYVTRRENRGVNSGGRGELRGGGGPGFLTGIGDTHDGGVGEMGMGKAAKGAGMWVPRQVEERKWGNSGSAYVK